jgi:hypothetical protein
MFLAGATATPRLLPTAALPPSSFLLRLFFRDQLSHHGAGIDYNLLLEVWSARRGRQRCAVLLLEHKREKVFEVIVANVRCGA